MQGEKPFLKYFLGVKNMGTIKHEFGNVGIIGKEKAWDLYIC